MLKQVTKMFRGSAVVAGAALAAVALAGPASAQKGDAAKFYKGKTITWIVPYKAGGGYDTYSRMIAPYLEKYTGATVVIANKPGAGGLVGPNLAAAAKPDGLTLVIVNGVGFTSAQIAGEPGMRFDLTKMEWIGRIGGEPKVWVVRDSLKEIRAVNDFVQSNKTYKWGATGPGSSEYLEGQMFEEVFKKDLNIITGFDGSVEIDASLARGEVDMSSGSVDSKLPSVQNGDQRAILVLSMNKNSLLPDATIIPAVKDLVSEEGYKILRAQAGLTEAARALATTPGVPKERVQFLREAFGKAMQDPELQAQAQKQKRPLDYLSGEETAEAYKSAINDAPESFKRIIREAYRGGK